MIVGKDTLTSLGLDLNFSENITIGGEEPYYWCSAPIVDLSNYGFKFLMENMVKLE